MIIFFLHVDICGSEGAGYSGAKFEDKVKFMAIIFCCMPEMALVVSKSVSILCKFLIILSKFLSKFKIEMS